MTNLFYNSLRKTRSHFFARSSPILRPQSVTEKDKTEVAEDNTKKSSSLQDMAPGLGGDAGAQGLGNTSAPGLLMRARQLQEDVASDRPGEEELDEEEEVDGEVTKMPEVLIRVRTATLTSADSSSLHTLTDVTVETSSVVGGREQRFSPNPAGAGAASATVSHIRHTTCDSVESEGFHSVTSEDMNLEDLSHQDWSQWSKQVCKSSQ